MTQATNLNGLGIQDLDKEIAAGRATVADVFNIVESRINKRKERGQPMLRPVVEYRNLLAEIINKASNANIVSLPAPVYARPQANAALPTDPEQLADVVFATVGAAHIGAVIQRLTARVVGQSVSI